MVTLPELTSYSAEDLARVATASPAFVRYRRLLDDPNVDPLLAVRHRAWCACAAATILDRASPADVCAYWSDVADDVLTRAWHDAGLGDLPALLITLGKHGARELNLSSDVDLMIVCEPAHAAVATRCLRKFQTRLAGGEHGFVYRLDFDLRPGGRRGPLFTTPAQFRDHYWTQGETWERLAMVRMRPLVGDPNLRRQIEELATKFSYRKFLDFTLLDDLRHLRAAVHQRGFVRRDGELHLKLEVGGIRDVELFVHAQLILHGGKQPALRTRSTTEALARLAAHGILNDEVARTLTDAYWFFRRVENGVQAADDRQTHVLSTDIPVAADVRARMRDVDRIVSGLLGEVDDVRERLPLAPTEQRAWLERLGFADHSVRDTWPRLMRATALSQKNERDERARRDVLYAFATAIAGQRELDRDLGLSILTDFVHATRTKATFYSTLLRVPELVQDLARLFCRSPYSGAILAARPELLDQLIQPMTTAWSADPETLLDQMAERRLLTELWAVNHLLAGGGIDEVFARETAVADQIAAQLLATLNAEHAGAGVGVLTLGKWGGRELGLKSDLDFVFVTANEPSAADFRVARRFITRLTDPGKGGALYDVDLRLRPSGQSGPLMTSLPRLREHWRTDAAAWQRQAYLRARPLDPRLPPLDRRDLVARPLTAEDLAELKRIRARLLTAPDEANFDLKHAPGGLIDVEFVAQTALLVEACTDAPESTVGMIERLGTLSTEWAARGPELIGIYRALRAIEQTALLTSAHRIAGFVPSPDVRIQLGELTTRARAHLNALDPTGLTY